jgi:hypothetical protein
VTIKRILRILFSPITWLFRVTRIDEKLINAFCDWFNSIPAFKQQAIFMAVWLVAVIIKPDLDPNMFHLMAFLTVYSAITQPLLAINGGRTNDMTMKLLKSNYHQMKALLDMFQKLEEAVDEIKKLQARDAEQIDEIDKEIEKLTQIHIHLEGMNDTKKALDSIAKQLRNKKNDLR